MDREGGGAGTTPGIVAQSARLTLRRVRADDAAFALELVRDPDWLRYIGDRGVRDLDDARRYLENGPMASYATHGFGLYCVERTEDRTPIGLCGILRREGLDEPDLGFAFLPAYRGAGYAREAAEATVAHAERDLGIARLAAITRRDNGASIRLLEAIGFREDGSVRLPGEDVDLLRYLRESS